MSHQNGVHLLVIFLVVGDLSIFDPSYSLAMYVYKLLGGKSCFEGLHGPHRVRSSRPLAHTLDLGLVYIKKKNSRLSITSNL